MWYCTVSVAWLTSNPNPDRLTVIGLCSSSTVAACGGGHGQPSTDYHTMICSLINSFLLCQLRWGDVLYKRIKVPWCWRELNCERPAVWAVRIGTASVQKYCNTVNKHTATITYLIVFGQLCLQICWPGIRKS